MPFSTVLFGLPHNYNCFWTQLWQQCGDPRRGQAKHELEVYNIHNFKTEELQKKLCNLRITQNFDRRSQQATSRDGERGEYTAILVILYFIHR